jgi:hypothetical protein
MNPKISISLEAQQWQVVCNLLAEGPYRVVASLLQTIQEQYNESQAQAAIPVGNGAHPAAQ